MKEQEESGWLIEHGSSDPFNPLYWCGHLGWTHSSSKAVRFARRVDAASQARSLPDLKSNFRIAQHLWL